MLEDLACICDATGCDRPLTDDDCTIVFETPDGERRAYECDCGAITMTVHRTDADEEPIQP